MFERLHSLFNGRNRFEQIRLFLLLSITASEAVAASSSACDLILVYFAVRPTLLLLLFLVLLSRQVFFEVIGAAPTNVGAWETTGK